MKQLLFVLMLFILISCSEERITSKPEYKSLVESVYSSVVINPDEEYKVNASITGYIDQLNFKEGDLVKSGDILFVISSKPIQLNQENAKLNFDLLNDTYSGNANIIEDMRLDLQSAKLKMQNDSLNFIRFKTLYNEKAASKFDYDNAAMVYEISKNNYLAGKKRIVRKEKELKNQINQSKNNLSASSLRTEDYIIRSTISGRIFQLNKEKGEYVSMQEPIAIIGDANSFKLNMLIDEVDISKVNLGQKVLVTLEAFKNKVFEAKVTKISPKMDERTQTFSIEAVFVTKPSKLYMGLTGEGNIVINEKKKALVIPREYLLVGNKVETSTGLVDVKTGLSNWSYIEITSGLNSESIIYKPQ